MKNLPIYLNRKFPNHAFKGLEIGKISSGKLRNNTTTCKIISIRVLRPYEINTYKNYEKEGEKIKTII